MHPQATDYGSVDNTASFVAIPHLLAEQTSRRPEHTAVLFQGERHCWREFYGHVNRVANGLIECGIQPNDKVAVLAATSPAYMELFLGTVCAAGCAVPLPGMATSATIEMMINDSDARVLAVSETMLPLVESFVERLQNILPGGLIAIDFEAPGWRSYEAWLADKSADAPAVSINPQDDFNLIYSSGTTGVPKGILHPHSMRTYQLGRMGRFGLGADAITLVSTPLYSNTTLVAVLPTLAGGGTVVLMQKFDAAEFLELAQRHRVTHAMLVPVQYQRILAHPEFDRYDLSAFRVKLSTSAPLRAAVIRDALRRWPGKLIEIYGLTEGGVSTTLDATAFPDKLDSVGRPAEGIDVRVIDEAGRELPRGQIGEIVGRSIAMMKGYYKRPDLTEALTWYDPQGNRFYRTGDMGRIDEDGFIYLLDRKKDMIISGGFNIYVSDLEQVLLKHAAVADVAVIGIPSERWGETPLALVVHAPGADITEEALREWANERLGKGQRIAAVEFRDELPRNTIGKVMKRELRAPYWEQANGA